MPQNLFKQHFPAPAFIYFCRPLKSPEALLAFSEGRSVIVLESIHVVVSGLSLPLADGLQLRSLRQQSDRLASQAMHPDLR